MSRSVKHISDVQMIVVKKAIEFGEAEVWMNERLSRAAPKSIATFLTAYADGPPAPGTPLVLVWKFEGKQSLDDAMQARDFPQNVEEILMGRKLRIKDPLIRKLSVIKVCFCIILMRFMHCGRQRCLIFCQCCLAVMLS